LQRLLRPQLAALPRSGALRPRARRHLALRARRSLRPAVPPLPPRGDTLSRGPTRRPARGAHPQLAGNATTPPLTVEQAPGGNRTRGLDNRRSRALPLSYGGADLNV